MVKKVGPSIRSIIDVPDEELRLAVVDMVNRLHIHGTGDGYCLYTAVKEEKKKAIKYNSVNGSASKIL